MGEDFSTCQESTKIFGANFGANFGENFGNFVSNFATFFGNFVQQKGGAKKTSQTESQSLGIFRRKEEPPGLLERVRHLWAPTKSQRSLPLFQKNPRVRKIRVRNSGAGNGCANFMDTWKNAFFLQEKPCP